MGEDAEADTELEIKDAGAKMAGIGMVMAMATFTLSCTYMFYAFEVLDGCSFNMHDTYLYLALGNFLLGVVVGVWSMRKTFLLLSSYKLIDQANGSAQGNG